MSEPGIRHSFLRSPYLWLALACVASLVPFIDKAFHIDDPLFLLTARQIQTHPLDFYGFNVNWYWSEIPMSEVTKNPPLAAYYIALVATFFGWSEIVVHTAFLVWPVGVILGTYQLAKQMGSRPVVAALTTLWTPVFLVSSSNVMSDTMMLCFWMWAVVLWERGLRRGEILPLCWSGVLIGLSALTKYFGISLIPLLLVYSVASKRRLGREILPLLIPVLILAGYQWATHALYGRGLLLDAAAYATDFRGQFQKQPEQWHYKPLIGLAFVGGCALSWVCFLPLLARRGVLIATLGTIGALIWIVSQIDQIGTHVFHDESGVHWSRVLQTSLFAAAGLGLLVLAATDLAKHRDAKALLLFLWIIGTYVFATFVNWTINGRSVLPLVPVVGILIGRRLAERASSQGRFPLRLALPLLAAAIISFAVAWSDYRLANCAREAATLIREKFAGRPGKLWFQGHWGFQYYMEGIGASLMDPEQSRLQTGDLVIVPRFNSYVPGLDPRASPVLGQFGVRGVEIIELVACPWATTMNREMGAGFYATERYGPLPFFFCRVPPERYFVVELTKPIEVR